MIENFLDIKAINLDIWHQNLDTNILYITGYSGSGKSELARFLANERKIQIIHLDGYTENIDSIQNLSFNKLLDKRIPEWKIKLNPEKFDRILNEYARKQYFKNYRVIVEGVQIADMWLKSNISKYYGKPLIVLDSNFIFSISRAFERDQRSTNFFKGLISLDYPLEYLFWCYKIHNNLKKFRKNLKLKKIDEIEAKKFLKSL